VQIVQDVVSSNFEVIERVPHRIAHVVTERATEECVTHKVFKCYPSKLTISKLRSCALEYRLPCVTRVMVPSPGDHPAFPPVGFVAVNPQHLEFRLRFPL